MQKRQYFVYILLSKMNRRFIGLATDVDKELETHNAGRVGPTKPFRPWQLEWSSLPMSQNEAIRLERQMRPHRMNFAMLQQLMEKN